MAVVMGKQKKPVRLRGITNKNDIMSESKQYFSRWTKTRSLGLRVLLPFTWCFFGTLVSGVAINQWSNHRHQQQVYQETTLALTGYLPEVAKLRQLACESGKVATGTTREAELIRTQSSIKAMQKEVELLPAELAERNDLIQLVTQMSDLADKVTGHTWEESSHDESGHEEHAKENHSHDNPKHGDHDGHKDTAKHESSTPHQDSNAHGHGSVAHGSHESEGEHAEGHGHEDATSETLHAQIETGFTKDNLPLQVRSIDSLFQTQVKSALEYIGERTELLNARMRICCMVLLGSIGTVLISSLLATAKLYLTERRLQAMATIADKRLNKVRGHYHPLRPTPSNVEVAPVSEVLVEGKEEDVVAEFLEKLAEQMSRLPVAVQEDRLPEVEEIARWLAGAAGTFGFDQFTQPARQLETAVQNSESEQIQSLIDSLEQLTAEVAGVAQRH